MVVTRQITETELENLTAFMVRAYFTPTADLRNAYKLVVGRLPQYQRARIETLLYLLKMWSEEDV